MTIKKIYLCGMILALCSCSSNTDQKTKQANLEFDVLCDKYTEFVEINEYTALSSKDRALRLESILSTDLSHTSNAYIAWSAIRNGPSSERFFLFKEAADSVGYKQWQCPAIKEHAHEIGL